MGARLWNWFQGVGGKVLGLGDADLMMMAGSFLGWQPIMVSFFAGVFPGLVLGLGQLILRGRNALPFSPALSIGIMLTMLGWQRIAPELAPTFFSGVIMSGLGIFSLLALLASGYLIRLFRLLRPEH